MCALARVVVLALRWIISAEKQVADVDLDKTMTPEERKAMEEKAASSAEKMSNQASIMFVKVEDANVTLRSLFFQQHWWPLVEPEKTKSEGKRKAKSRDPGLGCGQRRFGEAEF